MKKIMFDDRFGLTKAVLDGTKTMTRRIVPDRMGKLLDVNSKGVLVIPMSSIPDCMTPEQFAEEFAKHPGVITFEKNKAQEVKPVTDIREECIKFATYKIGEVVAVAQSYKDAGIDPHFLMFQPIKGSTYLAEMEIEAMFTGGWNNKMFVRADLMPHQIKITDIKVERLQGISDEDCMREGIQEFDTPVGKCYVAGGVYVGQDSRLKIAKGMINIAKPFKTPQEAFAVLIDKVSGKGTWERNPYCFCYEFKLVK